MKQKIEQLSRGKFEYQLPEILLSEEKLQISAVAGSTYRGKFIIRNSKGSRMKGVLYSSSRLFVLSEDKFVGEEITVPYSFSAEYMDPGDQITGEIGIITDCGETSLPFEAKVEPPACTSSVGQIRDMFQFTNLAKMNWAEAERVFFSEEFGRTLSYHDAKLLKLYGHLIAGNEKSHAMEEFLVSIRKKSRVTLTVDKNELQYHAGEYSFLDKLVIEKKTWGYVELKISTDCAFLQLRHESISSDDFHGNIYELSFIVEPGKMHAGWNSGKLYIASAHQKLVIPVCCHSKSRNERKAVECRKRKQYTSALITNYIRFRFNRISVGKYVGEARNILLGWKNLDTALKTELQLYEIHLLIAEGKESQARALLNDYETKLQTYASQPVNYAAIIYLSALCKKQQEETERARNLIRELYQRHPEEGMLLWFLLYTDNTNQETPKKRMEEIRTAFYRGNRSPILYYEAAEAIYEDTECLTELKLFELQVLHFAVKHHYLTKDAAARATYLALQEQEFNCLLLAILQRAYERYHEKETLAAVCHMLLLGSKQEEKHHNWYALAVAEQCKEAGLPEACLMSMPDDITLALDHTLLNYFAYHCELPDEKRIYLYANILTHRNAYAFIIRNYEPQIESFTLEQLACKTISRNMAILYDEVLPKVALTTEIAGRIPDICFYYEIECSSPDMKAVCVTHKEMNSEISVPLRDGHAYIEMFTENAEVLLIDEAGNRYISTVDYTLNKLVHLESLFETCYELTGGNDDKLLLNLAEKAQYYQNNEENAIELRTRVTRLTDLNPVYQRELIKAMIYHSYQNLENESLESYLLQIDLRLVARAERTRIIEYIILCDLCNVALKALDVFGFEGVDVKRLARLCNRLITNADGLEKVDVLVDVCAHVFEEGKQDVVILKYLTDYFYGNTLQMYELWKAARTMGLDTLDLEERLLGQMLFAESYISSAKYVFHNYYRSGPNKKLIRAFLSYYAYKYLINDRLVEPEIFDIMRREIGYEENEVCLLAVMKWYSTLEQLTDSEVNFVDFHLYRLEQRGIILPFFRDFKGNMRIPQNIYDKYYVEYRTDPEKRVIIHYTFEAARGESSYVAEEMTNVCYGIFVKEFVLFSNESLQYYIVEESDGEEVITESMQVCLAPEQTDGEDTKYYQLNMIIAAREMQDEKTALKLLEHYVRTDYAIGQLFRPL